MKKIFLFTALLFVCSMLWSQSQKFVPGWCHAVSPDTTLSKGMNIPNDLKLNSRLVDPNGVVIIPVVFHIVYNPNEDPAENVADTRIISQIDRLNTDCRKLNPEVPPYGPWASLQSDIKIEFRLACVDPQGNSTTGITRTTTSVSQFMSEHDIKYTSSGGRPAWPTDAYLNIWVGDLDNASNYLGDSQFPWQYTMTEGGHPGSELDGIVLDYTIVGDNNGSTYNSKGRIATHEIGHWLGLFHTFALLPTCVDADLVNDTPIQHDWNLQQCPTFPDIDPCAPVSPGAMYMNYMDYTDDPCRYMFTSGQTTRTRYYIGGYTTLRGNYQKNFFAIQHFPGDLVTATGNTIIVNLSNPACLTTSYTFSGPVTISQQDNQKIIFQVNSGICSGTVSVTATSGNYTDDYTFSFNTPAVAPSPQILNPQNNGIAIQKVIPNPPVAYTCSVQNEPGFTYLWTIEGYAPGIGGGVIVSGQGTSSIGFVPNTCDVGKMAKPSVLQGTEEYGGACFVLIKVKKVLNVNCASIPSQIIFEYEQCTGNLPCCSFPGQTCCVDCIRSVVIYPNPATDNILVQSSNNDMIYFVKVVDMNGIVYKNLNLGNGVKTLSLDTKNLKAGNYFVNIYNGKNWVTKQIKIAR